MKQQPTRLKITIPEPCHERWDKMTPTEKGAYCQSCEKEVMDFSGQQQDDISYYFKHKDTGKTCGRFTKAQLNQTYIIPAEPAPRRTWLRTLWLLPFTLLSKNVFGQERKPPVCEKPQTETTQVPQTDTTEIMLGEGVVVSAESLMVNPQQQNRLTGHVRNAATGAALPLAVIKVNDSLQTTTDSTGNFALQLPDGFVVDSFIVTLEGFSGKYVPFKGDSVAGMRDIKLEPLLTWQEDAAGVLMPFNPTSGWILHEERFVYGDVGYYVPGGDFWYPLENNAIVISGNVCTAPSEELAEEPITITHPEMLPVVPLHPVKTSTEYMGQASDEPLPETPLPGDEPKQDAVMPPPVVTFSRKRK